MYGSVMWKNVEASSSLRKMRLSSPQSNMRTYRLNALEEYRASSTPYEGSRKSGKKDNFMNIKQRFNYACERVVLWCIRGFLLRHSVVIAKEFGRIDTELKKFQAEVQFVAANHWLHLQHQEEKINAALGYCAALDSSKFGKPVHGSRSAGPIHHEHRESIRKQFTGTRQEGREQQ